MPWTIDDTKKFNVDFERAGGIRGVESIFGEESLGLADLASIIRHHHDSLNTSAWELMASLATTHFNLERRGERDLAVERSLKALLDLRAAGMVNLTERIHYLQGRIYARRRLLKPTDPKKTR